MPAEVRIEIDRGLATITLDRPPLNILTTAMLVQLTEMLDRAASAATVRVIQLRAEGKVFSAGVDIADHVGDRVAPMLRALDDLFDRLADVTQPILAIVQGAALGGGAELTLGTDLCWAAERATFGQPEIRLGLFAPPASVLLPRCVGDRRALELLLGGETIEAKEAERIGWVTRVFADERFDEDVRHALDRLLALSGKSLELAKRAVRAGRGSDPSAARRRVGELYLDQLMRTDDAAEGLAAFAAKRFPSWRHS